MQRLTKTKKRRRAAKKAQFSTGRRSKRRGGRASAPAKKKRLNLPLGIALEFYRPLKKPITVRIDADVLAWFKRDGKRYQTRINKALRKVMMKEMKAAGR